MTSGHHRNVRDREGSMVGSRSSTNLFARRSATSSQLMSFSPRLCERRCQRRKGLQREERLDRDVEPPGDAERELAARAIVAALQIADRLRIDADRLGQLAARDAGFGAEQ